MPAVALLAITALTGCATQRPTTIRTLFVKQGEPKTRIDPFAPGDDWRDGFDQAKRAMQSAVPPPRQSPPLLEDRESDLAKALREYHAMPTPETSRQVAQEYRRFGVLDAAHEYYSRAIDLDRRDAAAYDGRARIWRDWGMAGLGLGDAHRAVHYAPRSAAAHNTLGTMLAALGRWPQARLEFERAVALDPTAAYAEANLCYVDRVTGRATRECPVPPSVP